MDFEIVIEAADNEQMNEQIYKEVINQILRGYLCEGDKNEKSDHIPESIN